MALQKLHNGYISKSKSFLFPALGIKKAASIQPENTYIALPGLVQPTDRKLVVVYQADSPGFPYFERKILFEHPQFQSFYPCEGNKNVYVFSFIERYKEDWDNFLRGSYSKLSELLKARIMAYFGINSTEWKYMESYLYPHRFYHNYAELLCPDPSDIEDMIETLKTGVELCRKWEEEEETLMIPVQIKQTNKLF